MATASSAAFVAPALPIASVPTGMPAGICTIASRESRPWSAADSIGTPRTGATVCAATTPARCAAPPAAAMKTSVPAAAQAFTYCSSSVGVRCAESTRHSCETPKRFSVSSAERITSQSDLLPITTATSGAISARRPSR